MSEHAITLIKRLVKTIEEYEQEFEDLHKINKSLSDKQMELIQVKKALKGEQIWIKFY